MAEAMKDGGWLPHEAAEGWDRAELGSEGDIPLGLAAPDSAPLIEHLAARAANPQPLPLRHLPPGGVRIGAGAVPPQPLPRPSVRTTASNRATIYDSIVADVAAGVLERGTVAVTGRMFLGPKDRPIYDARWINDHIPAAAKTVGYGSVRDVVACGTHATKMDLKSAFRSVVVHEDDRPLLGVEVDGVVLRYARLPFGLATSPRLFCDLLKASIASIPVPPNHAICDYVDDIAVVGPDPAACAALFARVATKLLDDGWRLACAKTYARPTTNLMFLGFAVDIPARAVAITQKRLDKATAWADDAEAAGPRWQQALQKLLGLTAWAAPALRGAGFTAPHLYHALGAGWGPDAADALCTLRATYEAALTPTPITPPDEVITLVSDAGGSAWCAALCRDGTLVEVHRGALPEGSHGWSSTAREAVAATRAVQVFGPLDLVKTGIHIITDSQALAAVLARGRTRSREVARALTDLADLCRAGLRVTASWTRRSEGALPLVDAGTARATLWRPTRGLRDWLRANHPVDVHLGAACKEESVGPRYTADFADEVRAATVAQRKGLWVGWVGVGSDTRIDGARVLCHPRWGAEASTIAGLRAASSVLVLTRRTPGLATLFGGWPGSAHEIDIPPQLRWWVREDDDGTVRTLRLPDLALLKWTAPRPPSPAQAKADELLRLATDSSLNPGPRRTSDKASAAMARAWDAQPRGAPIATPCGPREPSAWVGRQPSDAATTAMRGCWDAALPARAAPQPPPSSPSPPATGGRRGLVELLRAVASGIPQGTTAAGPTIAAQAQEAMSRVADAKRARRGRTRAEAAADALADYAASNGGADAPCTLEAVDALALAYVDARIEGVRGQARVAVTTAAEEASSVAAALRAIGFPAEHYLGPRTAAYLKARGAGQRRDASNALPLTLGWLLSVEPPDRLSDDHAVWASRVAQAGFMLRPGVAGRLRRGHLTRWGPGFILSWPGRDKTRPGDVCAPDGQPQGLWRVTACGHAAVCRVLDDYTGRQPELGALLWPQADPRRTMAWLRRARPVAADEVQRLTAHGFRLELHELAAPPDIINLLGWWARDAASGKGTRAYYNSAHLGRLMMVTSRLGSSRTAHPAPGVHVGAAGRPVDWDKLWASYEPQLPRTPPAIRTAALAAASAAAAEAGGGGSESD